MGTLGSVSGYTAATGGRFAALGEWLVAAAAVALAVAIAVRFAPAIPWIVGLAGAGYVVGRAEHATVDGWAAVVGAGLLLAAELAAWAAEHDGRIPSERALVVRQLAILVALLAASVLVGFVLVGAAAVSTSAGIFLTALGVAAAVAAVAVILRLAGGPGRARDRRASA